MSKVFILTGPIRNGKTSTLQKWCKGKNVGGVLSPDYKEGRCFHSLLSENKVVMEADTTHDDDIIIGRFRFTQSSFLFAENEITKAVEAEVFWIIIDEIGPIELKGEGLSNVFEFVINRMKNTEYSGNLMIVVREQCVDDVIFKFKLDEPNIIRKEDLEFLS